MGFKKGETVTWESQSAGAWKRKKGVVIHVVRPNEKIQDLRERYRAHYNTSPIYLSHGSREEESYLVALCICVFSAGFNFALFTTT